MDLVQVTQLPPDKEKALIDFKVRKRSYKCTVYYIKRQSYWSNTILIQYFGRDSKYDIVSPIKIHTIIVTTGKDMRKPYEDRTRLLLLTVLEWTDVFMQVRVRPGKREKWVKGVKAGPSHPSNTYTVRTSIKVSHSSRTAGVSRRN